MTLSRLATGRLSLVFLGVLLSIGLLGLAGLVLLFALIPSPRVMSTNLDASVQKGRLKVVLQDLLLRAVVPDHKLGAGDACHQSFLRSHT